MNPIRKENGSNQALEGVSIEELKEKGKKLEKGAIRADFPAKKEKKDPIKTKVIGIVRQETKKEMQRVEERIIKKARKAKPPEIKVTLPESPAYDPMFFDSDLFPELAEFSGGGDSIEARYVIEYAQNGRKPTETHMKLGISDRGVVETIREFKANPSFLPAVEEVEQYIFMQRKKEAQVKHHVLMNGAMEVFLRCMQHKPVMVFDAFLRQIVQKTDEKGEGVYEFDGPTALKAIELMTKLDPSILLQGTGGSGRKTIKDKKMNMEDVKKELARLTRAINKRNK